MNWNHRIRQGHRWLSVASTLTGLYLFGLPYATRWRAGRRAAQPTGA